MSAVNMHIRRFLAKPNRLANKTRKMLLQNKRSATQHAHAREASLQDAIKTIVTTCKNDLAHGNKLAHDLIKQEGHRILAAQKIFVDETTEEGQKKIIQTGALFLNKIANKLIIEDAAFRAQHEEFSELSMQQTSPMFQKRKFNQHHHENITLSFRFMVTSDDFGLPDNIFIEGIPSSVFSMQEFNDPGINRANIKQITYPDPSRIGWTSGGISSSTSVTHPAAWGPAIYKQAGYLYCIIPHEGYNVAEGIHHNVGFYRAKGKSNAEGAREIFMLTYCAPEQVIAARKVEKDGTLGPLLVNKQGNSKGLIANAEFKKFIEANSVEELIIYDFLENDAHLPSAKKKAHLGLYKKDKELTKRIEAEAKHAVLQTQPISYALQDVHGVKKTADNEEYHDLITKHYENQRFFNNKKVFDDAKHPSAESLLAQHKKKI